MRILLLGDASNFHRTLAEGLRALGHTVTVASDGTAWMNTPRDIDLSRRLPGRLGGLDLWLRLRLGLRRRLTGYDIVSVAGQGFIELRPHRITALFDYIRRHNPNIFLTSLATDYYFASECLDPASPIRYSEFKIYGREAPYLRDTPDQALAWVREPLASACRHIYSQMQGCVTCLWEYDIAMRRAFPDPRQRAYAGIPIRTDLIRPVTLPERISKVRLLLGRHRARAIQKGAEIIEQAARDLCRRHPDKAQLVIVENLPYDQYLEVLKSCHIYLDQIYSYTPATSALLAMSYGLCTLSGGSDEYYDFIGEPTLRPILHVEPTYQSVYSVLEDAILNPHTLRERGLQGRELVVKHNDYLTVARRFLDHWQKLMKTK